VSSLNLLLEFQLAQDSEVHVRGAERIRVDGLGDLIVYDAQTGRPERIVLSQLSSLNIHSPSPTGSFTA